MTKFNTGNPVGSSDPRDLSDNASVADNLVTGEAAYYRDRLGKDRKSWRGIESEFAAFIAAGGYVGTGPDGAVENYAAGIEITQYNQIVRDTSGEFWRLSGPIALPYVTTGAGLPEAGVFVSAGDAVLRQQLQSNTVGQGSDLLAHTGTPDTVTEALNKRAIYVGSVAELEGLPSPSIGQEAIVSGSPFKYDGAAWVPSGGYITASAFGAVGDGVTDDTEAFKAALLFAKNIGGCEVVAVYSSAGYVLSETLYVSDNVTLDFSQNELLPVAVSAGGSYTANALIILGNPSPEPWAKNPKLKRAHLSYATNDADFPARPFSIIGAEYPVIQFCRCIQPNDTCFIAYDSIHAVFEFNYAENPRFHGFGTTDGADRAIFQYNFCKDITGAISGDSFCFDMSAENANNFPCIVRHNYAVNGLRFFKGQQQAAEVYGNYMENFSSADDQTVVLGYGTGIHFYNNTMVDCASPFLIGSGVDGPLKESTIFNNRIINRTVPVRNLISMAQDVENVKYENNYHIHSADFVANSSYIVLDRPLAKNLSISDNEFYITGTPANNTFMQITELNGAFFERNKIVTSHTNVVYWVGGAGNQINNNYVESTGALDTTFRVAPGGNTVKDNTVLGRFRIDGYLTTNYTGNIANQWIISPENDRPQSGAGDPVTTNPTTPRFAGDSYIDTSANGVYFSVGTTSSDWVLIS